jgi:hypothetical protein
MAIAVEHCGLHNRIALRIIMLVCLLSLVLSKFTWTPCAQLFLLARPRNLPIPPHLGSYIYEGAIGQ